MEPEETPVSVTPKVAQILKQFLEDPSQARYGYDLMQATGQPSGTLYPILAQLKRAGWIEGHQEDIDPSQAGRPRRRGYLLTEIGRLQATYQLTEISNQYRPPRSADAEAVIIRGGCR
ncbi:PadR family transcriptional regulator [Nonomuraea sp. NPDC050394]|uniref:PadR family transcriptional regulator n=1 Tax=Nonomuraea sp. NPDC050394 TaxID=3364363 RepID=UPI00379CCFF7